MDLMITLFSLLDYFFFNQQFPLLRLSLIILLIASNYYNDLEILNWHSNYDSRFLNFKFKMAQVIFFPGFKETAFAHAISSAGVTLAIARGCSSGLISNCGCDSKVYKIRKPKMELMPNTAFKWGGCSHNIRYGNRFSKWFLDSREKADDIQSKINLHNNQVGRKVWIIRNL